MGKAKILFLQYFLRKGRFRRCFFASLSRKILEKLGFSIHIEMRALTKNLKSDAFLLQKHWGIQSFYA
jgi:hypothetical protein